MEVSGSPRILITRLSHIGDCMLTLPVLTTLRKHYPDAFIAWAVESPTHTLLELHPDLDEIVLIPKSWARKPKNWLELSRKLKSYQFDVAIDPQGITKSALLGRISGARKRIGIRGRWGRELSPWLNNRLVETQSTHIVERSVELLSELGIQTDGSGGITFGLPVCPTSLANIDEFLEAENVGERFVVINPGAYWPSKRWENERFGSVASYLKQNHNLTSVIVWAGEQEHAMAREIHQFAPPATVIAPNTSLRELAALASRATIFMAGDTGPLHIASAMGSPCIGLHGSTRAEDSHAYGENKIAIQKWYQSGSGRKRKNGSNEAMRDILACDVFSACDQLLDSITRSNRSVA